jgi:hypothetical protein
LTLGGNINKLIWSPCPCAVQSNVMLISHLRVEKHSVLLAAQRYDPLHFKIQNKLFIS